MANRPQNSPKGLLSKNKIRVGSGGFELGGNMKLVGNTTGIVTSNYEASLPANVDNGLLFGFISNSTGFAMFLNSSGTTHKYLQLTSQQPT